ncbi:MAG: PQQ-binding-like beta-propeller repeat protein [Bacteroidetes bacterium]|nr:PQQ-binding-like beta-propeller repeat protein [Bacteroidota bacterium]
MIRYFSVLLTIMMIATQVSAQEIAQWRGKNRDGIYPGTGLLKIWPEKGPVLVWHYDGLGDGHTSASISGDRIFITGMVKGTGYVYSFSLDGKLHWKVPYGEEWTESWPGVRSTPLFYDGKLYLLSSFGKLICLNAANGAVIWSIDLIKELQGQNIQWGYTENLLIDGNMLFCAPGGKINNIVAFNKDSGKLIWTSKGKVEKSAYCSPTLINLPARKVLVTQTESSIIGLDANTGKLLWSHDQPNRWSVHANTPLYHEGMLFCMSGYGKGGVMLKVSPDGNSIEEVWRNASMDYKMGGFVLIEGKLYGADDSGKAWYCLDWKTGKEIFSEKLTGKGNIIAADGLLYCYGDNGEIVLARPLPTGFKKISSFKVPYGDNQHWAHLVIHDGRLYVRHGSSLMVYDIKIK